MIFYKNEAKKGVSLLSLSRTLEGLFKGCRLLLCIAYRTTEKQGHRHVCRPWRRGPKTPSKPVGKNLDSASVQNALAYTYS